MTQQPIVKHIPIHLNFTCMHSWIHALTRHERLIYHLNARYAFPDRIPIMKQGIPKGEAAHHALKVEKQKFIDSMKQPPTNMLIDSPDPHGKKFCLNLNLSIFELLKNPVFLIF